MQDMFLSNKSYYILPIAEVYTLYYCITPWWCLGTIREVLVDFSFRRRNFRRATPISAVYKLVRESTSWVALPLCLHPKLALGGYFEL